MDRLYLLKITHGAVKYFKNIAVSSAYEGPSLIGEMWWSVQKDPSRPVLKPSKERPQPLGRAERRVEYVSTTKERPACAKPLWRRQGTPLAAFFNTLHMRKI
jgi:hypothetical protein